MEGELMIREVHGNLLADDAEALVNTVNTVGVMGKGIALQFKRAYPAMFTAYARAAKAGEVQIGRMFVWQNQQLTGPRYIVNFPTKRHWRTASRMEDVEAGLADLARVVADLQITSIALPPLGCGNGGLDWSEVAPRIRAALAGVGGEVDIRIFPPEGAPAAATMIDRRRRPRMTATRAALLQIFTAYERAAFGGPSLIEAQKLAYFLQVVGEPLRLHFQKGRYGPYADALRHVFLDLEGHYLTGFGDGSDRALDAGPLHVLPGAEAEVAAMVDRASPTRRHVDDVLALVQGFESAYGLELLASVHWVATHDMPQSPQNAAELIRSWTDRKARLFTDEHVAAAWASLDEGGWLRQSAMV